MSGCRVICCCATVVRFYGLRGVMKKSIHFSLLTLLVTLVFKQYQIDLQFRDCDFALRTIDMRAQASPVKQRYLRRNSFQREKSDKKINFSAFGISFFVILENQPIFSTVVLVFLLPRMRIHCEIALTLPIKLKKQFQLILNPENQLATSTSSAGLFMFFMFFRLNVQKPKRALGTRLLATYQKARGRKISNS